jgi:hypothetical protein
MLEASANDTRNLISRGKTQNVLFVQLDLGQEEIPRRRAEKDVSRAWPDQSS